MVGGGVSLTARQQQLLTYLAGYMAAHGFAPSLAEMRGALGLSAKSSIHRLLICLEQLGHIRRLRNRERAIEVLTQRPIRSPDGAPLYFVPVSCSSSHSGVIAHV